jgi:excisionase family DNA binding protein
MAITTNNPPALLTVQQCCERLNVPRSAVYLLIMSKQLSSIKIGRLRRVPAEAVEAFIARQLAEQGAEAGSTSETP